jgi:hypothetical protein
MRPQLGGSFAPPLTDELLAKYKGLIEAMPKDSRVRAALEVAFNCCEKWWDLPTSSMDGAVPHMVGMGIANPLDQPIKDALWDHIPWKDEIVGMASLFDTIERETASRNNKAIEGWQLAVKQALTEKHFPDAEDLQIRIEIYKAFKTSGADWIVQLDPAAGSLAEKMTKAAEEFEAAKITAEKEIAAAISTKTCEGIPYPKLEPTPVRDMAHHLLWHVAELDLDREPITNDQLDLKPAVSV